MQRLTFSAPAVTVFPPVKVAQTTTTGLEAWRTDIRRGRFYGIYVGATKVIQPTLAGTSKTNRMALAQRTSPQNVYVPLTSMGGGTNGG